MNNNNNHNNLNSNMNDLCDTTSIEENEMKVNKIKEDKKILRKLIRNQLKEISMDDIQKQSQMVWNQLYQLKEYQNATKIGIFISMPNGEINTYDVLKKSCTVETPIKTVYVPVVGKNFEFTDMELIQVNNISNYNNKVDDEGNKNNDDSNSAIFYDNWPRNKWDIPEPPDDLPKIIAKPGELDLIIIPGLGFDIYGNRLGQGKGYYDRFLERMMNHNVNKKPYLIGVGLQCQLLLNSDNNTCIPTNEYDYPLDLIIVPNQIVYPTTSKQQS